MYKDQYLPNRDWLKRWILRCRKLRGFGLAPICILPRKVNMKLKSDSVRHLMVGHDVTAFFPATFGQFRIVGRWSLSSEQY
jgi:hypothetical protein